MGQYCSCWLVNFEDGGKIIFSEKQYQKHKEVRDVTEIESDEHWFLMNECVKQNPNVSIFI